MSTSASSAVAVAVTVTLSTAVRLRPRSRTARLLCGFEHLHSPSGHRRRFPLRVTNDSERTEVSPGAATERSEADKIVDGLNFGELCNEFECISSPSVEATARQLARDIFELREGNRALGTYAVTVKYKHFDFSGKVLGMFGPLYHPVFAESVVLGIDVKFPHQEQQPHDPLRSFTGREKYKRPLWVTDALETPTVTVQEMMMLSTSVLSIKWTIKGKPKSLLAGIGGDLIIKVTSQFTLNQISGQVIEHEEFWDLSLSSPIAQAYFWMSRRLFSTIESGKDVSDFVKDISSRFSEREENIEIYPDPSGDPTKFFQRDDSFQRDAYQIALFLALVYFVVQFLRTTL